MQETLQNLLLGFSVALTPSVFIYAVLGCFVGTVVGVLPGIGPLAGVSILLPLTFGLDATKSVILLAGIYYGAMYGGSTTSILMRIPGETASVVTCLDGYAMAQKGRAGPALAIAAIGSFIAGTFSVVALMFVAPPLARFALRFGPPEYVALIALAIITLSYMSGGSMLKSTAMALVGFFLGMVGIDRLTGYSRFDFGLAELGDGIGVVPVGIGLFGLAEILSNAGTKAALQVIRPRLKDLLPNRDEWRASLGPIGRGTVLGFFIGLMPGPSHVVSSFVSYAVERRLSKHPERFGQGAIEGVAGPESANNSATSGHFISMLALGIPSGGITAIILAALMIHGVSPGPLFIREHPDIFWGFIASMYVGNLVLLILNLPLIGLFVNFLRIPYAVLYPIFILFCFLGVYSVNGSVLDLWIMTGMGLFGYLLRKFDFEPVPIVIGMVLAPILELSLRQSLIMSRGSYLIFVQRPIALALLVGSMILLVLSLMPLIRRGTSWIRAITSSI